MRAFSFRLGWVLFLLTALHSVRCWSQELGPLFTESPQRLHPRQPRSEADLLRLQAATLTMEGRILERRGQASRALQKYQRAYRLDPDASVVLKQVVSLALGLGRIDQATRYAALLADTNLADLVLAEQLAMLLADRFEYDRSLQLYEHVLAQRDNQPQGRDLTSMRFEMGRLYLLTGKHHQAAEAFRLVLQALEHPDDHQLSESINNTILAHPEIAYNVMAEALLEVNDYDRASALFRKAAQSQSVAGWLSLQLARVDHSASRYEAAKEKLETYVRQKRQFAGQEPYRLLQEISEKTSKEKGNPQDEAAEGVLRRFRGWLAEDPDNLPLLLFVAELNRGHGALQEAAKLYAKSLELRPTLDGYRGLVATYRELGDGDQLLDALGRVTMELETLDPIDQELQEIVGDRDQLQSLLALARVRLAKDKSAARGIAAACGLMAIDARLFEVADEFFEKLDVTKELSGVLASWGLELLLADENRRAAAVFRQAIDSKIAGKDEALLRYYLAGALQLSGKTEEGLEAARRAASLGQGVPAFKLRPAWILFHAGRYDEAEQAYAAWLKVFGDNYSGSGMRDTVREVRYVMSSICVARERHDDASEWLEQILDEFPGDVGAMNDLGYLMVDRGQWLDRAFRMIQRAVEAEPENAAYRDSLGWAFYRLGKYDQAIAQLQKAAASNAPDPLILEHLGDAYVAAGKESAAVESWQRALGSLESAPNVKLRESIQAKLKKYVTESK